MEDYERDELKDTGNVKTKFGRRNAAASLHMVLN